MAQSPAADLPGIPMTAYEESFTPPFTHEKLQDPSQDVRLLEILSFRPDHIKCTLSHHRLDDVAAEEAAYSSLSYVWGSQEVERTIELNGRPFKIGANCFTALVQACAFLERERKGAEFGRLWIDAICINQDDQAEKAHQVWMMARIFQCSRQVIASIMDSGITGTRVAQSLTSISRALERLESFYDPVLQHLQGPAASYLDSLSLDAQYEMLDCAIALGRAEYWTRLWTVPEVQLAHVVQCCIALESVPYSSLARVVTLIAGAVQWSSFVPPARRPLRDLALTLRETPMCADMVPRRRKSTLGNLAELLAPYWNRKCKHPRDRVYALLPLLERRTTLGFLPDYSASNEDAALQVLLERITFLAHRTPWNDLHSIIRAFDLQQSTLPFKAARGQELDMPHIQLEYVSFWNRDIFRLKRQRFGRLEESHHTGDPALLKLGRAGLPVAWSAVKNHSKLPWAVTCKGAMEGDFIFPLISSYLFKPAIVIRHVGQATYRIVGMAIVHTAGTRHTRGRYRAGAKAKFFFDPEDLLAIAIATCPRDPDALSYDDQALKRMLGAVVTKAEASSVVIADGLLALETQLDGESA